jgi:hypothetical protein
VFSVGTNWIFKCYLERNFGSVIDYRIQTHTKKKEGPNRELKLVSPAGCAGTFQGFSAVRKSNFACTSPLEESPRITQLLMAFSWLYGL